MSGDDDTPPRSHSYVRRRTEELRPDELTNHRLQNLEEGVRQMTTAIAASHAVLGEINTRLAVGAERIETNEKRLASLEGDRRWIVLSFLTAMAALVWEALNTLFAHGPKAPLIAALVLSSLVACIPVTIYPPHDAAGKPIATPVTAIGTIETPAGPLALTPIYPVSDEAPVTPTFPWGTLGTVALALLGVGGGGFAVRAVGIASKAKAALKIACSLADQIAAAPDDESVQQAKRAAFAQQVAAGVHDITQEVRATPPV